ncbi:MAG: hypothetical protein ACTSP1_16455, partial [Candidatus Freyarchaeota archaeon]
QALLNVSIVSRRALACSGVGKSFTKRVSFIPLLKEQINLKVFQFLPPINRWASLEVMVTASIRGKAAENLPKLWKELKKKL